MNKGDIIQKTKLLGQPHNFVPPIKARVNWVIDDMVAGQDLDKPTVCYTFQLGDPDWEVIQASAPHFQSQVEAMSDEELRMSIEALRGSRAIPTAKAKVKKAHAPIPPQTKEDKLAQMKALLPPEQFEALKSKLGL